MISVYGAGVGFWYEVLRTFERNGHQEAGHYRSDIVRNCTCYPKPFVKTSYAQSLFIIQEVSDVTDSVTSDTFFCAYSTKIGHYFCEVV